MKHITKLKLAAIHQLCDTKDKSTEFMMQFMQDTCNVDHDCVLNYLMLPQKEKVRIYKELNELLELLESINYDKL